MTKVEEQSYSIAKVKDVDAWNNGSVISRTIRALVKGKHYQDVIQFVNRMLRSSSSEHGNDTVERHIIRVLLDLMIQASESNDDFERFFKKQRWMQIYFKLIFLHIFL